MIQEERRKSGDIINDLRDRVVKIEADAWHTENHWKDIKSFMSETTKTLGGISTLLALIQSSMDTYQTECTKDRVDHNLRISRIEKYQFKIATFSSLAGGLGGFLITKTVEWLTK